MFIKSYAQFKNTFNKLFKKYHPDNKETGDAELFIKYKKTYDEIINSGLIKKIINNEEIEITTTQAFNGCVVKSDKLNIQIPPKSYNKKIEVMDKDKNNILYKIYVKIIPEKDEKICYNEFSDLIITKIIEIDIFDIIFGLEKKINILGDEKTIKVKPYELLFSKRKTIENIGYPRYSDSNKRSPLILQFKVNTYQFDKKDIEILNNLREKYGKKI